MNSNKMSSTASPVKPFWHPLVAGVALGLVLLLTFVWTGHGLGATGASTRLSAWLGSVFAHDATVGNAYLGPLLAHGNPMPNWITWEVIGVALGALASAMLARRFRIQLDGARSVGSTKRMATALVGGMLSGFGARVAAGCTSGLGLSGAATLSIAAFVFLAVFFVAGLVATKLIRGV